MKWLSRVLSIYIYITDRIMYVMKSCPWRLQMRRDVLETNKVWIKAHLTRIDVHRLALNNHVDIVS